MSVKNLTIPLGTIHQVIWPSPGTLDASLHLLRCFISFSTESVRSMRLSVLISECSSRNPVFGQFWPIRDISWLKWVEDIETKGGRLKKIDLFEMSEELRPLSSIVNRRIDVCSTCHIVLAVPFSFLRTLFLSFRSQFPSLSLSVVLCLFLSFSVPLLPAVVGFSFCLSLSFSLARSLSFLLPNRTFNSFILSPTPPFPPSLSLSPTRLW